MKLNNKIWMLLAGVSMLASCELDTAPEGATVTEQQKQEVVDMNPERIEADVVNLAATIFMQFTVGGSNFYAIDFGLPSVCIANDYNGADMVCANNDYNWYMPACDYTDRDPNYIVPYVEWTFYYNYLKAANDILAAIPAETENETLKAYRGQALGARALALFGLVQRFQHTYVGNEDKPSIPIVTDDMTAEQASNNPRASLTVAYEQILGDLNEAIILLEGYTRPNKSTIDQQVAYGLRARVNLVMQNYAEAASDATKALAGYTPYTIAELGRPTFQDGTHHAWIWGSIINESDLVSGSGSMTWQSWVGSLNAGYGSRQRCYARCNVELYNKVPATDVRKGWWVDANLESPLIEGLEWPGAPGQPIGPATIAQIKQPFYPYTNVKFGPTDDQVGNSDNSGDWPLMRVEEMLLIQAEATGLGGNVPAGAKLLEDFVKTYRNPDYKCLASNEDMFRNEIWLQRRIELWGEGFAFQDMMRFNKPLVRFHGSRKAESNFPDAFRFNIPAGDEAFLCAIPRSEINANEGISEEDNNSGGVTPVPDQNPDLVDGVTD